jgi:hypothetical protein
MSQRLTAKINSIFVQLIRYQRQRRDFSVQAFLRDLASFFEELSRADLAEGRAQKIDDQLKTRVNSIPRDSAPLVKAVADLMVLYFWYVRRPGADCAQSLAAAKKLRGYADDAAFVEEELGRTVFGPRIKGLGKSEYQLREIMLERGAQVASNFKESDSVPLSATRIVRTDSWHKKMFRIAYLVQTDRRSEIGSVAPREELVRIYSHNWFAAYYIRSRRIIPKPPSPIGQFLKQTVGGFFSLVFAPFNLKLVVHVLRNRFPVYLVYLVIAALFVFGAYKTRDLWISIHDSHLELVKEKYPVAGIRAEP